MRVIAGLGNPGRRYKKTRHNLGRRLVDSLIPDEMPTDIELLNSDWQDWRRVYMNETGLPLAAHLRSRGLSPNQLLVVYDELDLPFGAVQLRQGGGSAGHQGVASVITSLGEPSFWRLRIGIGTPDQANRRIPAEEFVLKSFSREEEGSLAEIFERTHREIKRWLTKTGAGS